MTGNDSRPSLWERFVNWETGDESVLDGEIEQSMDQAAPQEAGGEVYASAEKRADDHRTALVEEERSYYSRVHEWSLHKGVKLINRLYRLSAVLVLCFIIFFLMSTVVALPPFGEADNPYNNEVSQRYIEKGIEETGAINFVAGMILDYRAFDTLGESFVLFTAMCAVTMLMNAPGRRRVRKLDYEVLDYYQDPIIRTVCKFVIPTILVFGVYILLNGHLSPGGGFSGGAIMASALIIYGLVWGGERASKAIPAKVLKIIVLCALGFYACSKTYSFFTGANHLHSIISPGVPGRILSAGLILPLNVAVGFVVCCTMYSFYMYFQRGEL